MAVAITSEMGIFRFSAMMNNDSLIQSGIRVVTADFLEVEFALDGIF
jgi:hypothetical protein